MSTVTASLTHCWMDGPFDEGHCCGTTCMLLDNHRGLQHWWVPDMNIFIQFPGNTTGIPISLHDAVWQIKRRKRK